jgi:hypothetical protein
MEGRQRIYQLRSEPQAEAWTWVEDFQVCWNASLDELEEHLERKNPKKV